MLRAVAFGVLWASLVLGGATWYAGYSRHAAERVRVARLATDMATSLFHPDRQREALQRYDSYGTAGPEDAIYFAWTDAMPAVGAWLACAAVWPAVASRSGSGRGGRAARWAVMGGLACGVVLAALFALGGGGGPAGELLGRLRGAWYGAALGGCVGTPVAGLLGYCVRAEPVAAADGGA